MLNIIIQQGCKLKAQGNNQHTIQAIVCQKCKRLAIPSDGKYIEQLELSDTAYGNVKCYNYFGKQVGSFLKI